MSILLGGVGAGTGSWLGRHLTGPHSQASTLLQGLVSWWDLDEASGSRADSVGSNTLTDNNTVLYANMGPNGVVASFVAANSERLNTSNNILDWRTSWTWAGWVKINGTTGYRGVFGNNTSDGSSVRVYFNTGTAVAFLDVQADTTLQRTVVDGEWTLLAISHDNTDDTVSFSLNAGTPVTKVINITVDGNHFTLGATYLTANPFNGNISAVGAWSRVLTPTERSTLYNSGAAAIYPFTGLP